MSEKDFLRSRLTDNERAIYNRFLSLPFFFDPEVNTEGQEENLIFPIHDEWGNQWFFSPRYSFFF